MAADARIWRLARRWLLLTGLLALAAFPAAARADVVWQVESAHGDQHLPPGGQGQYLVQAFNVGDVDTTAPYTVVDALPPGVTVHSLAQIPSDVSDGGSWDCSATPFPDAGTVTCTNATAVPAPGPALLSRGAADPLALTVDVSGAAAGTADNRVTVSGGSATATPAESSDATPFSSVPAGFGFVAGSFAADAFDGPFPAGAPVRQAGSHPFELDVGFDVNLKLASDPAAGGALYTKPDGSLRTLEARLPAGLIGNPQAVPQCDPALLSDSGPTNFGHCPANTQVGSIDLFLQNGSELQDRNAVTDVPVFNMVPSPGVVAELALTFVGNPVFITVTLDPADRYAVLARISDTTELLALRSARLTLWGVPADPAHDALRVDPDGAVFGAPFAGAPIRPYLTLPSQCGVSGAVQARADSWQRPGVFTPWERAVESQMTGCGDPRLRFDPSVSVQPTALTPSTPTGLDFVLSLPQKDDRAARASDLYAGSGADAAIATPPLRDVTALLPEGMTISPSAADGLLGCGSVQIALGSNEDPACPDASKVGTATIATPLLADPLQGSIYLASQTDNPFGSLLALYLVAKGPGVVVKLPGRIEADALTGQLEVSFQDTPQVPVSSVRVQLKSGARAPLVTPAACGTYTTKATMTSWDGALPAVQRQSSFTIGGDDGSGAAAACAPRGFDPGFDAGSVNPIAGRDSPIVAVVTRADRDQELGSVDVTLPRGLLGRLADTVLCSDGDARAGTCGEASRIGRVTVAAGPGPNPFSLAGGRVYVTGPYGGAPFGLALVVHAQAGPFDLGDVVVRAAIFVDRRTAALRIVTDPLPTILDGIPLKLRLADVSIDRPRFAFNPTSCDPTSATARIVSTEGAVATRSARFQVADCAALPFKPSIALTVGARHRTRHGVSTPLAATVRMGRGQANIRSVAVTLPSTLTALLPVVTNACTLDAFHAGRCEQARAGSAVAVTPLLRDPLRGGVYFVKTGRPLPDLIVALRGQVVFDLVGRIAIPGGRRLRAVFGTVPDVPIERFTLRFASGRHGPIGVAAASLCTRASRRATATADFVAQSGKRLSVRPRTRVVGCRRAARRRGVPTHL